MKIRLFIHRGKGHYIGSTIIVKAKDSSDAEILIRSQLDAVGLIGEEIQIEEIIISKDSNQVIYVNNGDY
jgi:RAB protein geranylgeranyltransferase component A